MASSTNTTNYNAQKFSVPTGVLNAISVAERNCSRKVLTIYNTDNVNTIYVYPDNQSDAPIPVPAGQGIDIKPPPMNSFSAYAVGGVCVISVWEG